MIKKKLSSYYGRLGDRYVFVGGHRGHGRMYDYTLRIGYEAAALKLILLRLRRPDPEQDERLRILLISCKD